MKLATLRNHKRDGELIVVNQSLTHYVKPSSIAMTMQNAIDNWHDVYKPLQTIYNKLNANPGQGEILDISSLIAPLPRAYQWVDGSVYTSHVKRVRRSRGAELPENFATDPLIYQGGSDIFLGPQEPIRCLNESYGLDFEAEIVVITDDVPIECNKEEAKNHIILLGLINDISLRYLAATELAKGFGFYQSKPSSAFAPVFVTPDELIPTWDGYRLNLPVISKVNQQWFGSPHAGVGMQFDFPDLITHAAKTRSLGAGTIIGSGTVSNDNPTVGFGCILEKRSYEITEQGKAITPFLKPGDHIHIEVLTSENKTVFGAIQQRII